MACAWADGDSVSVHARFCAGCPFGLNHGSLQSTDGFRAAGAQTRRDVAPQRPPERWVLGRRGLVTEWPMKGNWIHSPRKKPRGHRPKRLLPNWLLDLARTKEPTDSDCGGAGASGLGCLSYSRYLLTAASRSRRLTRCHTTSAPASAAYWSNSACALIWLSQRRHFLDLVGLTRSPPCCRCPWTIPPTVRPRVPSKCMQRLRSPPRRFPNPKRTH